MYPFILCTVSHRGSSLVIFHFLFKSFLSNSNYYTENVGRIKLLQYQTNIRYQFSSILYKAKYNCSPKRPIPNKQAHFFKIKIDAFPQLTCFEYGSKTTFLFSPVHSHLSHHLFSSHHNIPFSTDELVVDATN